MSDIKKTAEAAGLIYLDRKGLNPKPTNPHKDPGIPDFKCSKKRWAEIKTLDSNGAIILHAHQLRRWKELIENKETVYLIISINGVLSKILDVSKISFSEFMDEIISLGYDDTYGVDVWQDQKQ